MAADKKKESRGARFFSYFEGRRTREGVPTPHLMEELNAPKRDVPLWSKAFAPLGFALVMVAMGVGCFFLGSPAVGVLFCLFGLAPAIAVVVLVCRALPQVLGPRRDASGEELGPYLGGGGDQRVRDMCPGLFDQEREKIEWNRADEAHRTWEWLQALPCPVERVECASDDGTRLVGRAIACNPDSDRWLVFAHGYNDTWRAGLTYARRYADLGFNLLLVDLRAHGESDGAWVGAGWLDRRDLVSWCRWVADRAGAGARVTLAGISMGAAAAVLACGEEDLPGQVRACVADSAYDDFWNTAVGVVSSGSLGTPPMPAHPIVDLARLLLKLRRGGYDIAKVSPAEAIAHSAAPVLLLQGEDDKVVPAHMADALAAAAGGAAEGDGHELVKIPSAGHCCAVFADPDRYWEAVGAFVGAHS